MQKILIIDDDQDMCIALSDLLKEDGFNTLTAYNGNDGLKITEENQPDLILLDYELPDIDGMKVLEKIKKIDKNLPVVMLTAYGKIKSAVQAMKAGAFDYITKPFENEEISLIVKKAVQIQKLGQEVKVLRQRLEEKKEFPVLIGKSSVMQEIFEQIKKVALTDFAVFLQGESGTGKEVVARTIHSESLRKEKPFITVDCGALPETLIESELLGYEKGAFTGADKSKLGQFELAEGGTIFLDEITNLTPATQAKLLRVIQEKEIQHLGGKKKISVNVRIITASNLPLEKTVREGRLREDLYHRINEFNIQLPPLQQRNQDIILLANHFLKETNEELHKQVKKISSKAISLLERYNWPGNVRELRNTVRRAVLLADDTVLPKHFQVSLSRSYVQKRDKLQTAFLKDLDSKKTENKATSLKRAKTKTVESIEKKSIQEALLKTGYHRGKVAKTLGIGYRTLYNKMKKYGL
ncbi:MAG: sigma-54-dependent Fis family transcriptional regulator [Elusimicrobia bacterium]|nr:sigma-54-dependent Fis family transcriptional regulator [Elusimicrobiota bacterium]